MTIGHHDKPCELCGVAERRAGRLCSSCCEMIARLFHIAREGPGPAAVPEAEVERPMTPERAARLFERALNIDIFNVSRYKRESSR